MPGPQRRRFPNQDLAGALTRLLFARFDRLNGTPSARREQHGADPGGGGRAQELRGDEAGHVTEVHWTGQILRTRPRPNRSHANVHGSGLWFSAATVPFVGSGLL